MEGGWDGNSISNYMEIFYFHLFLIEFSPNDFFEKFNSSDTRFDVNSSQHDNFLVILLRPNTLMCPAHYCVQNILSPHLPKGSFVQLSHVKMLRLYHAVPELNLSETTRLNKLKLGQQHLWYDLYRDAHII